MKEIKSAKIIGMGALGLLYADMIQSSLGKSAVSFVMDKTRFEKYNGSKFRINGIEKEFRMELADSAGQADLVLVAVKYPGLSNAIETMKKIVGSETVIISVLNGISSEEIIGEAFGMEKIVFTVAQAMDAMKFGSSLKYTKSGELRIGIKSDGKKENLAALEAFFDKANIAYTEEADITRRMWGKFMLNVGINQTCMAFGQNYSQVLSPGKSHDAFISAMKEVIAISRAEGINLTEDDLNYYMKVISTLDPNGTPSMGQDRIAKRKSEVELFSGTVIRIAKKHGISVPTNQFLHDEIKRIEAEYTDGGE